MTRLPLARATLTLAITLLATGPTRAADPGIWINMKPALNVPIEATSLQFGAGVGIASAIDGADARGSSAPSLSDIVWTQRLDTTYPLLMRTALSQSRTTTINTTTIDLVSSSSSKGLPYLSLAADRSVITGLSMSNDTATASVAFDKLTMTYDPVELGKMGQKIVTSYDLTKGTVTGPSNLAPRSVTGTEAPVGLGGTSIYMRLGSGSTAIAGESRAAGYENWILIDSAQMGVGIAYGSAGSGGARQTSVPSISEMTISRAFDATVPVVFADLLRGDNIGQVTIEYVTGTKAGPQTFMQLALDNVMFTSLSLSTGGDRPSISESLNFTAFSQTVWDIEDDGTRGRFTSVGYDIVKNTAGPGKLADGVAHFGTGNLGQPGSASSTADGPVAAPLPVPEPGTWLMMLAGLGVLAGATRRRLTA